MLHAGTLDHHPVRQDKVADEIAGGDAPVQKGSLGSAWPTVLVAPAGDDQLIILDRDRQLLWREPCNR